jgi:hypothetical protein
MLKRNCSTVSVGGRVVGEVVEGKFIKRVKASRHMLRDPKGWGLDVESLADARDLGAESVEIHDTETDITYSAPVARIQAKGFRFDRGFGPQICLALQYWSIRRPGEAEQLAFSLT